MAANMQYTKWWTGESELIKTVSDIVWMSKYAVWTTGNLFKYHGIKKSTKVGNETPIL